VPLQPLRLHVQQLLASVLVLLRLLHLLSAAVMVVIIGDGDRIYRHIYEKKNQRYHDV
jgi:hypothetical protein